MDTDKGISMSLGSLFGVSTKRIIICFFGGGGGGYSVALCLFEASKLCIFFWHTSALSSPLYPHREELIGPT